MEKNECVPVVCTSQKTSSTDVNSFRSKASRMVQKFVSKTKEGVFFVDEHREVFEKFSDKFFNFYNEMKKLRLEEINIEAVTEVELAKLKSCAKKYDLFETFLIQKFSQQSVFLSDCSEVLHKALADGNNELLVKTMNQMAQIVTQSPFEDIKFQQLLENPEEKLFP